MVYRYREDPYTYLLNSIPTKWCFHTDDMQKEVRDTDKLEERRDDRLLLTFNQLDIKSGNFKRFNKLLTVEPHLITTTELS